MPLRDRDQSHFVVDSPRLPGQRRLDDALPHPQPLSRSHHQHLPRPLPRRLQRQHGKVSGRVHGFARQRGLHGRAHSGSVQHSHPQHGRRRSGRNLSKGVRLLLMFRTYKRITSGQFSKGFGKIIFSGNGYSSGEC